MFPANFITKNNTHPNILKRRKSNILINKRFVESEKYHLHSKDANNNIKNYNDENIYESYHFDNSIKRVKLSEHNYKNEINQKIIQNNVNKESVDSITLLIDIEKEYNNANNPSSSSCNNLCDVGLESPLIPKFFSQRSYNNNILNNRDTKQVFSDLDTINLTATVTKPHFSRQRLSSPMKDITNQIVSSLSFNYSIQENDASSLLDTGMDLFSQENHQKNDVITNSISWSATPEKEKSFKNNDSNDTFSAYSSYSPLESENYVTYPTDYNKNRIANTSTTIFRKRRRNLRERNRVKLINKAFLGLKQKLPLPLINNVLMTQKNKRSTFRRYESTHKINATNQTKGVCDDLGLNSASKISKVETLRIAIDYIQHLKHLLA
ncbi:unnamed protein product [Gordionus sp. m RMFG-2023]